MGLRKSETEQLDVRYDTMTEVVYTELLSLLHQTLWKSEARRTAISEPEVEPRPQAPSPKPKP